MSQIVKNQTIITIFVEDNVDIEKFDTIDIIEEFEAECNNKCFFGGGFCNVLSMRLFSNAYELVKTKLKESIHFNLIGNREEMEIYCEKNNI